MTDPRDPPTVWLSPTATVRAVSAVFWWLPELAGAVLAFVLAILLSWAGLPALAWVAVSAGGAVLATVAARQVALAVRNESIRRASRPAPDTDTDVEVDVEEMAT